MRKSAIFIVSSVLFLASLVIGYHYVKQDQLIFNSHPLDRDYEFKIHHTYQEVYLPVGDGEIHGLHFKSDNPKGIVLFLHGKGKNLDYWKRRADFFLEHHQDVFIIDYRGFGKSSPGFKEEWFLEDALTAYDYLTKSYDESQITVYGNSLGTAMATWVASKRCPKKLVLECPYYSMIAAAASAKPYMPEWMIKLVLKYPLQTYKWIGDVKVPVYILHGKEDRIVPFMHGQLLYEIVRRNNHCAELIPLDDWGHNHIERHEHYEKCMADILL